MLTLHILNFSQSPEKIVEYIPSQHPITQVDQVKPLKKQLRRDDTYMLLIDLDCSQTEIKSLIGYIREGLANPVMGILLYGSNAVNQDISDCLALGADLWLDLSSVEPPIIQTQVERFINKIQINHQALVQSQLQTNLLVSVTQFSESRSPMQELIEAFSQSLHSFCHAHATVVVQSDANETCLVNHTIAFPLPFPEPVQTAVTTYASKSFKYQTPDIDLFSDETSPPHIAEHLRTNIGASLAFPLVIYGKNLCSILCFIDENKMGNITVENISVMKDAAKQLRVLMERRYSENRLKSQYQRLKSTLSELEMTKDHLIHVEKMASVGKMAAGIAHEINNPLSYVLSNFSPLDEYIDTMVQMLQLHDQLMSSLKSIPSSDKHEQIKKNIESFQKESDIDFIYEDIRAIVNDSREGLLRVRDIISDLSKFSRKVPLESASFDLFELVDETLRILKYELQDACQVQVDVEKDVEIIAHRGFVQQILTNLLKNAAQVLKELDKPIDERTIEIQLQQDKAYYRLFVIDNGPGMPASIMKQIFDPFFTTKKIGKGVGLGLSVCYDLAIKMGGTLTVESEENTSTHFCLSLPLDPNQQKE